MSKLLALAALALAMAPAPLFAQASPSPFTSGVRYDAAGRVTGTISADPDTVGSGNPFLAVRNSYDGAGNLTKVETGTLSTWQSESVAPASWGAAFSAARTLETLYDAVGHKIRETVREGAAGPVRAITQYSYDNAGRLECTAVRMNPSIYGSLPASACTLGTTGGDGPDRIIRNVYDAAGQRVQLREGVGSAVEAAEATWAYNLNGQVTAVIDGNGNRAALVYDGHGRQSCWMFPSTTRATAYDDATQASALASAGATGGTITSGVCATGDFEAYTYDLNGNRTNLRKRDTRNIAFAYDALGRVTAKTYPQGGATAVYYGYDLRNLQLYARFTSTSGEGITNIFDGFGRLTWASSNMGGNTRMLDYQYDPNGNRIRITHPDSNYFNTTYDGLNRPLLLQTNGSTTIAATDYYAHGAPWVINRIGQATEINYDNVQRPYVLHHYLPTAGDVYWVSTFNPAGQINATVRTNDTYAWTGHYAVARAYTTNGLNQYSAAGSTWLSYDLNGNLTASGSSAYVYDIENRMVGAPGSTVLSYDPLGRLFQVTTASTTTQFLYDGDAMVAEYNGSNALLRRHVHNIGADVPMATYAVTNGTGLGTISQLFADRQGSIVAQLTSGGVGVTPNTYDEYGIPGVSNTGRFQYTGQIWLDEIGMYYYKARIYSPTLGRFMQTDPIGYDDQFNLYAYVGNDPVNATDPSGLWSPAVHETLFRNVLRGRFTADQIQSVLNESFSQDRHPPGSTNLAAHHLRAPGERPSHAMAAFNSYVNSETSLARRYHLLGNDDAARAHFARAGHAISDAYSPPHRDANGDPAVYNSSGSGDLHALYDAIAQGHSPWEGVGNEDMRALARSGSQAPMERRLIRLYNSVFGPPRMTAETGSRIAHPESRR